MLFHKLFNKINSSNYQNAKRIDRLEKEARMIEYNLSETIQSAKKLIDVEKTMFDSTIKNYLSHLNDSISEVYARLDIIENSVNVLKKEFHDTISIVENK